jgi:hypothetical protein
MSSWTFGDSSIGQVESGIVQDQMDLYDSDMLPEPRAALKNTG